MKLVSCRPQAIHLFLCCLAALAGESKPADSADVVNATPTLQLAAAEADELMIVDCALPPQVRALGTGAVYASARRVTKLPASECRIRGGEYIVPTRALDAWLPRAEQGDLEAMTYVGEIYEKGIGTTPDLAKAAYWYTQAAEKGYPRAQVSLATLYERGAGVPKDPARAIALYRKAAGLPDRAIDPAAVEQMRALEEKLEQRDREIERLRNELSRQRSELKNERSQIQRTQRDLGNRKEPGDPDLVRRQQEAVAALAKERDNTAKLNARIKQLEATLADADAQGSKQIEANSAETKHLRTELQRLKTDLATTNRTLAQKQTEVDQLRREASTGSTSDKIQRELHQKQASLDAKEKQVAELEARLKEAEGERDQLKIKQAGPLRSAESSGSSVAPVPRDKLGRYHALVIGNDHYLQLPQLGTAVNDAKEISRILREHYGFEVVLLTDATRHDILVALNAMRANLNEHDNLLIYYAGHGEHDAANQHGNWLPVDAEPNSTANWISDSDVTNQLNLMTARQVLVIADSCYGGSLTRGSGAVLAPGMSDDVLLARILTQKKSRMVLSSGGLEPVIDDLGGSHSVFATALITVLNTNKGMMSGTDLYQKVIPLVTKAAFNVQARQVPEYGQIKFSGHESGDFFFASL